MGINMKLYKLDSKLFKDKNDKVITDVTLTHKEAVSRGYTIGIGANQLVSWIYKNRGIDINQIGHEVGRLKVLIKSTKGEVKQRYIDELQQLLFIDEIVQVDIESKALFKKISSGFTLNEQQYVYLVSKGKATLTYCKAELYDELSTKLNGGRNTQVKINASKLSAYKSLSMTNSKSVTAPNRVIVVAEQVVKFKADYLYVNEEAIETRINQEVERTVNDGACLITPEVGERWANDMGFDTIKSAFQVRQLWTKGIQYVVDFQQYFRNNGITHIVDVWGDEQSVEGVDCILNASQVKLWSAYSSCEDWLVNADKFGYNWRVAKYSKKSNQHRANYQQLITFDLNEEDIKELIAPSINHLDKIQTSWEHQVLYMNGRNLDGKYTLEDNNIATALMIDERLSNDKFINRRIKENLLKTKNDMKTGNLLLERESYFRIAIPDPLQLLEGMVGVENSKGSLSENEIHCKAFDMNSEMLIMRSPMLTHENIAKVKNTQVQIEHEYLYRYLDDTVIVFNGVDMLPETLCGEDWDGDTNQITQNPVLMKNHKKTLPIVCANLGSVAVKEIIEDEEPLLKAASLTCSKSVPNIGATINKATAMYSIMSTLDKNSEEYREMKNRLLHMTRISQSVIDASKCSKWYEIPKGWLQGEDDLAINKRTPAFQLDKYAKKKTDYSSLVKKLNFLSIANFGITLESLLKIESSQLTANQMELIQLYNDNVNVFLIDNNSMNRISNQVQNEIKDIATHVVSDKSTKDLLKSSHVYDLSLRKQLESVLQDYTDDVKQYTNNARVKFNDKDERHFAIEQYKVSRRDEVADYIMSCDIESVTNAFVDIVYASNRFSEIMWDLAGEQIIKNLLAKNNNEYKVIVADNNGSVDYLGDKYSILTKNK